MRRALALAALTLVAACNDPVVVPYKPIGSGCFQPRVTTDARVENGNVFVTGSDRRKRLVCELQQLSGKKLTACTTEPSFTLGPERGGYCYSTAAELIGEACKRRGSWGTIRFLGQAATRAGSEVFAACGGG